ncbi:mitochondrial import inner membrane translocase subunit TIM22-2-like [Chlorella sorokiniana]|uniref:Mitochondrial import inner membrane translocase subunit TIM22-2-like n=1 Tax=Chlorella sorokiniana TaxID=3076 RepID=A0A2P6U5L4_CHLSO|nr:mitochondrial import inner membrane translocase subunit TIM22-2-like [Chlorella sorokiniana]|eukprot:PRW61599.1 mitochondrial import inner membrane translocase subunit TIM22-2-like [Chlorella sorokiniana]
MGKKRGSKAGGGAAKEGGEAQGKDGEQAAVLSLKMDSSTPEAPREVAESGAFQTPCSISGLGAGVSGGMLGFVWGFGGYWIRSIKGGGQWKLAVGEGWASAQTFAIMSGVYAAVGCFMQRLRQKNDAWNGAASGCATGLALGWKQGPMSALQSCAMLGIFSYFIDGMSGGEAQAAALRGTPAAAGSEDRGTTSSSSGCSPQQKEEQLRQWQQKRKAVEQFLSPVMPLLAAAAPCVFAWEEGSGSPAGGCRVVRRR